MTDNVENLLCEHLKRFQSTLERVERKQDEMARRLANLEGSVASIIRQLGNLLSGVRRRQIAIDNIGLRLDRIERCLELAD